MCTLNVWKNEVENDEKHEKHDEKNEEKNEEKNKEKNKTINEAKNKQFSKTKRSSNLFDCIFPRGKKFLTWQKSIFIKKKRVNFK
ncbi:conserved Plasmodium protein, unknown function [Plasmodium malariae]|uniref:Uncharacterized protein n=1 Tax=Plasmodium malariae TaxID=5858 RepID=A0A1A8X6M2_PLAMA|nr:conserved Plasmodium protein, unknown function [Plasmodium malariae]